MSYQLLHYIHKIFFNLCIVTVVPFSFFMIFLQKCPDGYYSATKAGSCSQCPAGQKCFDGTNFISPTNCAVGFFSALGQSTCTQCESGTGVYEKRTVTVVQVYDKRIVTVVNCQLYAKISLLYTSYLMLEQVNQSYSVTQFFNKYI